MLKRLVARRRRRDAADAPVINHIFRSPDGDEYVLVLVEARSWDQPGVVDELAVRISLCLDYATDGELAASLPETNDSTIRIHVDHVVPATPAVQLLFARASKAVSARGLAFTAELLDPHDTE